MVLAIPCILAGCGEDHEIDLLKKEVSELKTKLEDRESSLEYTKSTIETMKRTIGDYEMRLEYSRIKMRDAAAESEQMMRSVNTLTNAVGKFDYPYLNPDDVILNVKTTLENVIRTTSDVNSTITGVSGDVRYVPKKY